MKFWNASDTYERENGSVYREIEAALPRELSIQAQQVIIAKFVTLFLSGHPYTAAIHCKRASDGLEQPHVHLMWSERVTDGFERDPSHFFKRAYTPRARVGGALGEIDPARGGCRKISMQPNLMLFREVWATLVNGAYEAAGILKSVDHRSLLDQGIDRLPTRHLGPSRIRHTGCKRNDPFKSENSISSRVNAEESKVARRAPAKQVEFVQPSNVLKSITPCPSPFIKRAPKEPSSSPTTAETTNSASCAEGSRWLEYRAKLQESTYGSSSTWLAKYWFVDRSGLPQQIRFTNSTGNVTDKGHRIEAKEGNQREIKVLLELATLKGWTAITFSGTDDFKVRAMSAALREGKVSVVVSTSHDTLLLDEARRSNKNERNTRRAGCVRM